MTALHPTTIKLYQNHCGHAIHLWKQNAPYSRDVFHVGVVAHAILEVCGKAFKVASALGTQDEIDFLKIANALVASIATDGRAYDGIPEDPIPLTKCFAGRDIALKYMQMHPFNADAQYEEPFAYDKNWNLVDYNDPTAIFRTIIDIVEVEEILDEDELVTVATVTDYKSSWRTSIDDLDNLQRRAQAVSVWLKYKPDMLIMRIANLRTGAHIQRHIHAHHEVDTLHTWKQDIDIAINVVQADPRPAPGLNCIGCPYAPVCDHRHRLTTNDAADSIQRYGAALSLVKELEPLIRKRCDHGVIATPQGKMGFLKKERTSATKEASAVAWDHWQAQGGDIEGFLKMIKPTSTELKKIAKKLFHMHDDIQEFHEATTTVKTISQFGTIKS
jgi:hypothetical protein